MLDETESKTVHNWKENGLSFIFFKVNWLLLVDEQLAQCEEDTLVKNISVHKLERASDNE